MKLQYSDVLGPAVRIGILQNQSTIRVALNGSYRLRTKADQDIDLNSATEASCSIGSATPGVLQWRLVLKKAFNAADADGTQASTQELTPLKTIQLGFEFGEGTSTIEYWRCSKPFATVEEAEAVRASLPVPERIAVLKELVSAPGGDVVIEAAGQKIACGDWLRFEPVEPETSRITVHDVIVGLEYHWRHFERQRFRGIIEIRIDNAGQLTAISELPVEAYLFSVNSSEMMSVMPEELLKAQTVAARNTMFATMGKHHYAEAFHLCSDDHCQCYRGSSRETADSRRVTLATAGEVMVSGNDICDARYSKCCGGFMEAFESVWNEDPRVYLPAGVDADPGSEAHRLYPADTEERAAALINAKPDCWCNTTGEDVPHYLTYTAPYFRWTVRYTRNEAEQLISRYLGKSIGELKALVPLKRGASGRIEFLKIVASNGEWKIGKELQIRKALSPTCLYSTAFLVEYERQADGSISHVILRGGGWGHGAGLCQIGATMMAYRGRGYREILDHYYPNTRLAVLAPGVEEAQLQSIISHVELRVGERCYEFYNCYAVAKCPVYTDKIPLEAESDSGGKYTFGCADGQSVPDVKCEFLNVQGKKAMPKG